MPWLNHNTPDGTNISFLKKLGSDSFTMWISRVVCLAFSLVRIMIISRFLGVAAFGLYSFGLSLAIMVTVLGNFGLSTLVARDGARDRAAISPLVSSGLLLMVMFSIVLLALFTGTMHFVQTPHDIQLVFLFLLVTFLFQNVSMMFVGVYQAYERIRLIGILHIFLEAVTLICVIVVFSLGGQLLGLSAGLAIAYLIRVIFLFFGSRGLYSSDLPGPGLSKIRYIFSEGYAIAVMEILLQIYIYIDTAMLMLFKGERAVGIYHGGFRLYHIMIILPAALGFAGLPVLSRTFRENASLFRELFHRSFQWLILLGLPLSFGALIYAHDILVLVFGFAFESSVPCFRILMLAIPFTYIVSLFNITLISMDLHRTCMKLFIMTILVNIILNIMFIPLFSASGPAIATLCSECFFMLAGFRVLKYHIRITTEPVIVQGMICTLAMSFVVMIMKYYFSLFIPGVCAGGIIYILSLFFMGVLKPDDLPFSWKRKQSG